MSPQDINSSILCSPPSPSPWSEDCQRILPGIWWPGECCSRPGFRLPSPLNHSCSVADSGVCLQPWSWARPVGVVNSEVLISPFCRWNWGSGMLTQDHTTTKWESSASVPSLSHFQTYALHHHLRLRVLVTCHIFTTYQLMTWALTPTLYT